MDWSSIIGCHAGGAHLSVLALIGMLVVGAAVVVRSIRRAADFPDLEDFYKDTWTGRINALLMVTVSVLAVCMFLYALWRDADSHTNKALFALESVGALAIAALALGLATLIFYYFNKYLGLAWAACSVILALDAGLSDVSHHVSLWCGLLELLEIKHPIVEWVCAIGSTVPLADFALHKIET